MQKAHLGGAVGSLGSVGSTDWGTPPSKPSEGNHQVEELSLDVTKARAVGRQITESANENSTLVPQPLSGTVTFFEHLERPYNKRLLVLKLLAEQTIAKVKRNGENNLRNVSFVLRLIKTQQNDEGACAEILDDLRKEKQCREQQIRDFFRPFPQGSSHEHGESLIPVDEQIKFVAQTDCWYDPAKGTIEAFDDEGRVAGETMVRTRRNELRNRMSLASIPAGREGHDWFFNTVCPLIDSISVLMPYSKQHGLMVDELIRQNVTYQPIMIDLPKLHREAPERLTEVFFNGFGLKLDDQTPTKDGALLKDKSTLLQVMTLAYSCGWITLREALEVRFSDALMF